MKNVIDVDSAGVNKKFISATISALLEADIQGLLHPAEANLGYICLCGFSLPSCPQLSLKVLVLLMCLLRRVHIASARVTRYAR
jgi:hypothetical protein